MKAKVTRKLANELSDQFVLRIQKVANMNQIKPQPLLDRVVDQLAAVWVRTLPPKLELTDEETR